MHEYQAPLADMKFVLRELVSLDELAKLPGFGEMTLDLADAVLEEAANSPAACFRRSTAAAIWKARAGRMARCSPPPDGSKRIRDSPPTVGARCPVRRNSAAKIFPGSYRRWSEEMWNGANVAFALCPMLTRGAIDAIELRGSQAQRDRYLPKMVAGEWTGSMNLTEPQAGSDLSAVRTRAVPTDDGRYLLTGQKIFITYGEHDSDPQHRAHGAGAQGRGAGRRQGHFPVPGAEVPGQCRRYPGGAQRRSLRVHRAQARNPRQPHLRAGLRAERRRRRGTRRRGESRTGIHVHHDECGPLLGGHRRRGYFGACLPDSPQLRARASSRHLGRHPRRRLACPSSGIPTCAACCCS